MAGETESSSVVSLLTHWHVKCRRSRAANYLAANAFSKKHTALGVLAVSISAVVGTSVFASLGKQVDAALQIVVGGMSVLAAVLAALQTFLKYGDRASAHRLCGARYAALVRQIEMLLAVSKAPPAPEVLEEIRTKMDRLAEEAPELPERLRRRSLQEIPSLERNPIAGGLLIGTGNTQVETAHPPFQRTGDKAARR